MSCKVISSDKGRGRGRRDEERQTAWGDRSSREVRGQIASKEEEREDNGVEEASSVEMREN